MSREEEARRNKFRVKRGRRKKKLERRKKKKLCQ